MAKYKSTNYEKTMIPVKAVLVASIFAGLAVSLFLSMGYAQAKKPVSSSGSVKFCTKEYMPVCGSNGVTYGNGCEAKVANANVSCNGTCPCGDGDRYENPLPKVTE